MTVQVTDIGSFNGMRIDEAILRSDTGVCVSIMNWGCVVRDWQVPVAQGMRSVVLGFEDFDSYPLHSPHFGAIAGRVANRIGGAKMRVGEKEYHLDPNENGNTLHGGAEGLSRQVWSMETDGGKNAVKLSLRSPHGHMGFPGNIDFEVIYTLSGNKLRLEMRGVPDRPTPISLVQHHYFNLGETNNILNHSVHMPFSRYRTVLDDMSIATGEIRDVEGTKYDFTTPRTLRNKQTEPEDYDGNFVLDMDRDIVEPIAIAAGDDKALVLKLWSDRPGLQFYNSVWLNIEAPELGEKQYQKHAGLCFEDQMFPNAVNITDFPSIICEPELPYYHWCEIEIK